MELNRRERRVYLDAAWAWALSRREFLGALATAPVVGPMMFEGGPADTHPVLATLKPVIEHALHVRLHADKIRDVAGFLAYEALEMPDFRSPLLPASNEDVMDFIFLTNTINFAFTDFAEHTMFRVSYAGGDWSDSDAMVACLKRALDEGKPILEGGYLSRITKPDLAEIFSGSTPMPMLDERVAIFRDAGRILQERYQGRFHHFVQAGPRRLYADGRGLLERLVSEFPSFEDKSDYRGRTVVFRKRAQLLWWNLHARFRATGFFALEDPEMLTVFADYIVPVALRVMGITSYTERLESAIRSRAIIPADSEEEIEIRAFTVWACHLLTEEINRSRPETLRVIDPVVDGRLWTHFHKTHFPHHLTVTTNY